ncbi:MAG: hypothetical protein IIB81_01560, partial [Nanoarchaeota archaeon]|nr:hypothetical protein [Nanoarchaeota archaeon]
MDVEGSIYRNLISHIDLDRGINSIEYVTFRDINTEAVFKEFLNDVNISN